ncbi:MAG: TfoX/Sxy family protein [Gordonibacter sp.]|uniref:TfoX/Sxy family protein n=1 Tax=Gordonibacter sp. TaxID=1968902 RepID=UPI002FC9ADB8
MFKVYLVLAVQAMGLRGTSVMASSEDYLAYVLDLLSEVPDISHRKMMGEYVLYAQGKVFGGIYDDRFLVKPTNAAKCLLPDADYQLPYEGAKPLLAVDSEDKLCLAELVAAMLPELPGSKKRK